MIIILLTKSFLITNENSYINFNNNLLIHHLQNSFIDLLWKYMESKHGFHKSFQLFTQFILIFQENLLISKRLNLTFFSFSKLYRISQTS